MSHTYDEKVTDKMRTLPTIAVLLTAVTFSLSNVASAQTATFEDLIVSTNYPNGGSFTSDGITFNVEDFNLFPSGSTNAGSTTVANPNSAGAGNGMTMGNVNLDVVLPSGGASAAGFAYAEFGGNINLSVNGMLFNTDDFVAHDGFSNSEFSISVSNVSNSGFVSVTGAINQFSFGGQELNIDDVRIVGVPEPSTVVLGALALVGAALMALRR